ncbi:MAG: two-component regulator propeller domain-containing protein [Chitinophagales bacterium]
MKSIRTIFTALITMIQVAAYAQPMMYRHYDLSSVSQVIGLNCIASDPFGMMWVGTSKGLYTFDGTSFHTQPFRDTTTASVTSLHCDSDQLWVGFSNGKLIHRSVRIWKKDEVVDTTFKAAITAISSDESGKIWVATYGQGLFLKSGKRWLHFSSKQGLPSDEIYCIQESGDGTIWIGTDEGLTSCNLKNDIPIFKTYKTADGLTDQIVKSLFIDKQQNIWIGTYGAGVIRFNPHERKFDPLSVSSHWSYGPVTAIAIQSDRRMMIGTQNNGVISIALDNPDYPSVFNENSGYADAKVTSLMVDEEGNFWVTSENNGLDMFPGLFQWVQGISSNVQAVSYDSTAHKLWYATQQGLRYLILDGEENPAPVDVPLMKSSKELVITSIYRDVSGNIWVGTLDEGAFVLPGGKLPAMQFKERDGLVNNSVLAISGNKDVIWFATLGGASRCIPSDINFKNQKPHFENFTEEKGLRSSYVYQIFIDSKGRTWFATDGDGLKYLADGKFYPINQVDSVKIKTVYSITEDRKGNIWFSTPSSGIFRFDGKTFRHFDDKDGISDLTITGIVADKNNDVLILEKDGVEIFENRTEQIRRYLDRTFFEGIEPNINAFYTDGIGNIWITTSKGILEYFPPDTTFSNQARLELTRVQVFLQPFDYTKKNDFPHNQNHLTFDFQGFWNYNPSQISYRYMLEGYDLDWIKTKDERVIYPSLPAGHYTFKVQATIHHNFNDVITRSYDFTINPPFWLTWWFIVLCLVAAAGLIYTFTKWREFEIEKEQALKRKNIEFQLENLKTQINPHFLFNSFNTLSTLIEEDQKLAISYVENLADFYRSTLKYRETDLISLHDEKELSDNYVFLLKQRHGEGLLVNTNFKNDNDAYLIPPLTLQLLIENAVKHNVVSKARPLTIDIESQGEQLVVKNNLQRKPSTLNSTRMGLKNISARFEILGGKPIAVEETSDYFRVNLQLFKNQMS